MPVRFLWDCPQFTKMVSFKNVSRLHSAPSSLVTRKSPDFCTGQCVLFIIVYVYLFDKCNAFVRDLVNQLFYQTNTRTNETCSYMWPTSPWTSKQHESCKKVTSVLWETIQHSAERCLCTRTAQGAGAFSWKHILSCHICLLLRQVHLCWGHLCVTQSCISLCKVNQSHPSCARTTRVIVWYLGHIKKSVHYT